MSAYGENEDQGKSWNEKTGRSWAEHDQEMNSRLQNISDILFAEIEEKSLSNALDIGCGAGATTLRMAQKLSGRGAVTGIDISDALLTLAREKASAVDNMTFTWADAQSHRFEPAGFDGAFSRFGVMFFADPDRAFANLRSALVPGSKLVFVCWAPLLDNPFFLEPMEVVRKHTGAAIEMPGIAPGPMAFSDRDYLSGILRRAGYRTADITTHKTTLDTHQNPQEDAALLMKIGAGAQMLSESEPSKAQVQSVRDDFVLLSAAKRHGDITRYPATIHLVTAVA
ncbi:MAG: class I SAM-dependent methyltransferase [Marinovum sp.]|nr:class I SAM-dependent methyltransferase [Marinovum sp.]